MTRLLAATIPGMALQRHAVRECRLRVLDVDKADVLVPDGVLTGQGSEAAPIREHLKGVVASRIHTYWPERVAQGAPGLQHAAGAAERLAIEVRSLVPKGDEQAWFKSRATELMGTLL